MTQEKMESVSAAGDALFRLGRKFSRFPQRDVLSAKQGRGIELSHILVVQAAEARQQDEQEVTIGGIADYLEVDPSTASRLVASARRAGYLTLQRSSTDGRATNLALTPSGVKLASDAREFQRSMFETVIEGWTAEEKTVFIPLFLKFVDNVIEALSAQSQASTDP